MNRTARAVDMFKRWLGCFIHGHIMERVGDCGDGGVMFQCFRCWHTVIVEKPGEL